MGLSARQEDLAPSPLPFNPNNGSQTALGHSNRVRQGSMQSLPSFIVVGPPGPGRAGCTTF